MNIRFPRRTPDMYYKTQAEFNAFRKRQAKQAHDNAVIFREKYLSQLLEEHRDKWAVMRDGEIVEICDDHHLAFQAGSDRFEDFVFSIKRISDRVYRAPAVMPHAK